MPKSKILQNSGIYATINLLQKGINFLLVPVLTAYLTTYDYGVVAVVIAINAFLNVFYLLSLNGTLNRFYYEYKGDNAKLKSLFGTIVTFVLLISVLFSAILLLGHEVLIDPFLDDVAFYPYMFLGMISVFFNPIFTIYQNTLQAKQEGTRFAKNNLSFFVTNVSLLLFSVIVLDLGAKGVLGSLAVTNVIFFVMTLTQFRRELKFGINIGILKDSLKYSIPLVPHSLSGVANNIIDRLFVNNMLSTSLTGIYNLGSTFGGIIFLLASGVNQAFIPWFNEQVKASRLDKIPKYAVLLLLLYSTIALGISFFGKEIIFLITPEEYHQAWIVIPFISFAFVYHGIYYLFSTPLLYDISGKGSRTLPKITITAAILNVVFNLILIEIFGIIGAAISSLITKIFVVLVLCRTYKNFLSVRFNDTALILIPALYFTCSLIVFIPLLPLHELLLKIVVFIALGIISSLIFRDQILNGIGLIIEIRKHRNE